MQAGRHPLLWGVVGIVLMVAGFFLVALHTTALLTRGEGVAEGDARVAVVTIAGVIPNDVTERTVRQLTKYGDDASIKDSGKPTRTLRPEERQVFQALVDDVYQQFVEAVAQGRNLPMDEVRQAADGRIVTGRQAKDLQLVDEIGSLHDAVSYAASTSGIVGKPKLVQERKERFWGLRFLFESLSASLVWTPFSNAQAVLQYRWLD